MNQNKKRFIYWLFFGIILLIVLSISAGAYIEYIAKNIPDNIYVTKDNTTTVELNVPITGDIKKAEKTVDFSYPVTFAGNEEGNYQMNLKLFGLFDMNTVSINVVNNNQVFAGGFQTGIYLKSDGLLVTKTDFVTDMSGTSSCPARDILNTGDYIIDVNGSVVNSKTQLIKMINDNGNNTVTLTILRDGEKQDLDVIPVECNDGVYRIGVWVKDDTQGIGTVTYIGSDGKFAALGHGISDSDTGELLKIKNGLLYKTNIVSVVKGTNGHPGEFVGTIDYKNNNIIGSITDNTETGIYGTLNKEIFDDINLVPVDIGYSYEVKKGNAQIRIYNGADYKDYDINIYSLNDANKKNITFEVVSKELLDYSNGIIQGMSGCPIMQNGKIIGAVTHVFVDNPNKGYGIYIEKMLN